VWADSLLAAEQRHILLVVSWGAFTCVTGTAILAGCRVRAIHSSFLERFAGHLAVWGGLIGIWAVMRGAGLTLRDADAAARLERNLWLSFGIELGFAVTGIVIAMTAWFARRSLGGVGAGIAVGAHGAVLALLDLRLLLLFTR
jgi:hypothetical protein